MNVCHARVLQTRGVARAVQDMAVSILRDPSHRRLTQQRCQVATATTEVPVAPPRTTGPGHGLLPRRFQQAVGGAERAPSSWRQRLARFIVAHERAPSEDGVFPWVVLLCVF
eukprot:9893633-Alexandrium_andersonii.AAC.1